MTTAVATPSSDSARSTQAVPIVILGTDALLAALPATPVQLAHACLQAGFANAVPASWGDELIAAAVLRKLPQFDGGPAIQCSCPIVAHRLLSVGGDLRPAMLGFVAPPVAIARYIRALSGTTPVRITYIGGCPGANDDAIDIRMRPDALLALLAERDIVIEDQPRVFESILPPDRRRFRSQPGGVPTAESLWSGVGARTLVEMDTEDLVTELAQQLLTGKNVLIDVGPHLGCVCSGAVVGVAGRDARAGVVTLEPPRAMLPVVEEHAPIELDLALPAASRTPLDISAVVAHASPARGIQTMLAVATPPGQVSSQPLPPPLAGHRFSPVRGMTAIPELKAPSRPSGPSSQRPVLGATPVARDVEGKSLPRAYVARRRPSPRAVPAITPPSHSHPSQAQRSTRGSSRATVEVQRPASESALGLPATSIQSPKSAALETARSSAEERFAPPSHEALDTHASELSVVTEQTHHGALNPVVTVAPEPITFFDKPAAAASTPAATTRQPLVREIVTRESVTRDSRESTPSPIDGLFGDKSRASTRPRPSVERETRPGMSTRRLIFLGAAIAIVLSVVTSIISSIIVSRVVRSSETSTAPAASSTPPTSTKPN